MKSFRSTGRWVKRALLKRKEGSMPDEQLDQQHGIDTDGAQNGIVFAVLAI
jgi:hypothetical protein